jgi:NAD(P)-dependent dehydrogenase (short-subunit alcohol dehydrogenase family)
MKKVALITGANSGIGFATAIGLLKADYKVILWARTMEKAEAARTELLALQPNAEIDIMAADLSNMVDVEAAAENILARYERLDVLINNAGYYPTNVEFTSFGVEQTLWASHFGHFLLTQKLLPILEKGQDPRIVNVSSTAHVFGSAMRFFTRGAKNTFQAYSDAKLANVLFTLGFRLQNSSSKVKAYSLHPGVINSNLPNKATGIFKFFFKLAKPFLSTTEKGAATSLYLATTTTFAIDTSAIYFEKQKPKKMKHADVTEANARWFWAKTEEVLQTYGGSI